MSDRGAVVAQWMEPEGRGIAARASLVWWVEDANGFWYPTTGRLADGYMVEDNGFTAIDENASSGLDVVMMGDLVFVR